MKALVLSDIHGMLERLQKATKLIHNGGVGLVILLGDITQMGGGKQAREVVEALKPAKVLGFPGNFETAAVQKELERQGISLHGKKEKIGQFTLVGFGGGLWDNPGQFLFSEQEIRETLERLIRGEENAVLLTHLPAYGTKLDLAHSGKHIGSKSVRKIIEGHKPRLHLCGHCHEGIGEERVGRTLSINVGAVKDGNALLLELNGELKWRRIKL